MFSRIVFNLPALSSWIGASRHMNEKRDDDHKQPVRRLYQAREDRVCTRRPEADDDDSFNRLIIQIAFSGIRPLWRKRSLQFQESPLPRKIRTTNEKACALRSLALGLNSFRK